MIEKLTLKGPVIAVPEEKEVCNIIVMLHGYGSNGQDLLPIGYEIQKSFPNIFFSFPNAPFKFESNINMRKWFEVYPNGIPVDQASTHQQKVVIEEFYKSSQLIKEHVSNLREKYNINLNKFFLLGFSQGSMMSIEVGTNLESPIAGILSLSGRIWAPENFTKIDRKQTPILLIHGNKDEIIPVHRYNETAKILKDCNISSENHLIKNLGHSINSEVLDICSNFVTKYV